jgi:hypothetical protein
MAGDVANPRIWENADVYVGPLGTTPPATPTATPNVAYKPLGLLSEDDNLVEHRDEDSTDHYAYGNILVRTQRSKHKRTFTVTALEDNPTVWGLVNPGSTATSTTGVTTRVTKVPSANPQAFLVKLRDGGVTLVRAIARGEVTAVDDVTFSDSDMTGYALTITVYPDSAGVLYTDITDNPAAVVA